MKINKKALDREWFEFEKGEIKARFQIRPFPLSLQRTKEDDTLEPVCEQFIYALTAWDGITDENDVILACSDENKTLLFNFDDDIREFVFGKMLELREKVKRELKN